jgi:hypothetical protein
MARRCHLNWFFLDDISVAPASVLEPGSFLMLATLLAGLGWLIRRCPAIRVEI